MTISRKNARYPLTIDREFKKKLHIIAKRNDISVNELIIRILKNYVDNVHVN